MPFDLSVDAAGSVYVLDDALMRVSKFGADGSFVWTVDGASDNELKGHVHDADIDSKGRIVLGNDDTGRVVYLDGDGMVLDAFSAPACEVTIDPADDLLCLGGCGSDAIDVYDPQHRLIGSVVRAGHGAGWATTVRAGWRDPRARPRWPHRRAHRDAPAEPPVRV